MSEVKISPEHIALALANGALRLDKLCNAHANLGKTPALVLAEQLNKILKDIKR